MIQYTCPLAKEGELYLKAILNLPVLIKANAKGSKTKAKPIIA